MFKDETAIVSQQYTRWIYPAPIADMAEWVAQGNRYALDIELSAHLFWPRAPKRTNLNILIAGCGTNQAAYYALRNPNSAVTGIDLSETSLGHEKYLKDKHGLSNLRLIWGSLLDAPALNQSFDLIICTGVLHHLPEPDVGLQALKAVLKPDGVIGLMVYGQSLRTGVYVMQEAFQLLGLQQSEEDVRFVRSVLGALPPHHMVQPYLQNSRDLADDSGVVDTFLHRVDRAYSVTGVLSYVRENGLDFMRWVQPAFYDAHANLGANHPVLPRLLALPQEEQWQVTDLLLQKMGKHELIIAHPEHAKASRLDFAGDEITSYVPLVAPDLQVLEPGSKDNGMTVKCRMNKAKVDFSITGASVILAKYVDGGKTIGDIVRVCTAEKPVIDWLDEARNFFSSMNRIGAFQFRIREKVST